VVDTARHLPSRREALDQKLRLGSPVSGSGATASKVPGVGQLRDVPNLRMLLCVKCGL
jgi:hypothetical protein